MGVEGEAVGVEGEAVGVDGARLGRVLHRECACGSARVWKRACVDACGSVRRAHSRIFSGLMSRWMTP